MNFGSLHIATLWRLARHGVPCTALVVDGDKELRLVITEAGRIVQWERFPAAAPLRRRAEALLKARQRAGWAPQRDTRAVPSASVRRMPPTV